MSRLLILLPLLLVACQSAPAPSGGSTDPVIEGTITPNPAPPARAELVAAFESFRREMMPPSYEYGFDYSPGWMSEQHAVLGEHMARLEAMDTTGWSTQDRVDWHLLKAQMNGLDFSHRVLEPWKNNPAWYVKIWMNQSDTPSHEGPQQYNHLGPLGTQTRGFIDIWEYEFPLTDSAAADLEAQIRLIPAGLMAAREWLTGNQRDLWRMGIKVMRDQARDLGEVKEMAASSSETLNLALDAAQQASVEMADWLEAQLPSKTGTSGIGKANYDWYMKNVHLSPYTWEDELRIVELDLARSHTALKLEENHNRNLPPQEPIDNAADFERLQHEAVTDFLRFFSDQEIVTMKPYMDAALRARVSGFSESGPGSFFSQVVYRDPIVMQTHWYHWIDLARMRDEPHPSVLRSNPLLFNIWDSRSEGLATAMEEWMMHAGFLDGRPRSRELIYILIAQRAARAKAGLMMHAQEWTLQEASDYASAWTPRGWMAPNSALVGFEQHLYLQQPGYGSSYLTGKAQLEELMAQWAHQEGDAYTTRRFFDTMNDKGMIPVSMIQWEMTGVKPAFVN